MGIVIVDDREVRSEVVKELKRLAVNFVVKRLEVADYDVGGIYGIERKTANDFINSIIDRRLFDQAIYLKEAYETPILVVEGNFTHLLYFRSISLNAIFGALAALAENKISVLQTASPRETALFIYVLSKRLEKKKRKYVPPTKKRVVKMNTSIPVIQLNLISSIPGISYEMAERSLQHFKTPRKFFTATPSEIKKISGLGEKRIKKIIEVLDTIYMPDLLKKSLEKDKTGSNPNMTGGYKNEYNKR